ncbi:hypothetical protein HPB48_000790 [Haemaphysalis longicornis]|uniref:Uncharacterized protein n=1 Tax=Haemaphysalis longicornis TaxID=44386 RepID=A0A9J6FN14_HAELO|nr:hypothetical protein HPB48_000790 [Haemaphysalis longicornis]
MASPQRKEEKHACDILSLRYRSKEDTRLGQKVQDFAAAELWQGQALAKLSNRGPVFSEEVDDALFEFLDRERSTERADV